MKKIIMVLVATMALISLMSCGNPMMTEVTNEETSTESTEGTSTETPVEEPIIEEPEDEDTTFTAEWTETDPSHDYRLVGTWKAGNEFIWNQWTFFSDGTSEFMDDMSIEPSNGTWETENGMLKLNGSSGISYTIIDGILFMSQGFVKQ